MTAMLCHYCGRPIGGIRQWIGQSVYHPECTQSPHQPQTVQLLSPAQIEQVRQVVLEQLIKTGVLIKRDPMD